MKEIVVISGKGGTGKTSVTASLAVLGGKDVIVADCDVDAADMHLLMQPDFEKSEDFFSGELAYIHQDECTQCGICADVCRFDAIPIIDGKYIVDPLSCEGCGYCARICPTKAIENKVIPPTINYENPDPELNLDYIPNEPRESTCNVALNNSFGFGGQNICLVVGRLR